jgi:hypothetical protein
MNPPRPIFIIGAPRSGTSITTWALGQHPNIQPMPETAWIASLGIGAFLSHAKGSERGRFSHLSNVGFPLAPFMARIGEAVDAIVHDAFARRRRQLYGEESLDPAWRLAGQQAESPMHILRSGDDPKRRWIDGTPLNTFYLWALSEMFPEARFIHNLRRPEQVATSLEGFDRVGAEAQALDQGLETWMAHTENAWYGERAFGRARAYRLDFHRLASEPETLFRDVCAFLGEEFNADCLLPLREKLNSSQVDHRREENLERLRGNPVFERAMEMYRMVSEHPPAAPDEDALEVVRRRFLDYCSERALV